MESHNGEEKIDNLIEMLREEASTLRKQRDDISARLANIGQILRRLNRLRGSDAVEPPVAKKPQQGVTRACRLVLMQSAGRPLTVRQVCHEIEKKLAPELSAHRDAYASVCTILGRLVDYGEVEIITTTSGKRTYKWVATSRHDEPSVESPEIEKNT